MSDNYLTKQEQIEAKAGLIRIILKTQDILERLRDDEDEILTKEEAEEGFKQIDEKLTALEETLGIGEENDEAEKEAEQCDPQAGWPYYGRKFR